MLENRLSSMLCFDAKLCLVYHCVLRGSRRDIKSWQRRGSRSPEVIFAELEEIVAGNETTQSMIKLYLADTRTPSESLLNGVVDISPIDAPGLNHDIIKTTAVFAHLLPHLHNQPPFQPKPRVSI